VPHAGVYVVEDDGVRRVAGPGEEKLIGIIDGRDGVRGFCGAATYRIA